MDLQSALNNVDGTIRKMTGLTVGDSLMLVASFEVIKIDALKLKGVQEELRVTKEALKAAALVPEKVPIKKDGKKE